MQSIRIIKMYRVLDGTGYFSDCVSFMRNNEANYGTVGDWVCRNKENNRNRR